MPLDTDNFSRIVGDSLDRLVVDVDKSGSEFGSDQRLRTYCIAMVLGCDVASTGFQVHTGMVHGAVSKLQLVSVGSRGQGEDLHSETDSHNRDVGLEQLSSRFNGLSPLFHTSAPIADADSPASHL